MAAPILSHLAPAGAAAAALADFASILPCAADKVDKMAVCVVLEFARGGTRDASVGCKALPHDPQRAAAPNWFDFLGSSVVKCDVSRPCPLYVQDDVQAGFAYDVFCIEWDQFPPAVAPQCGGGNACGVTVTTQIPDVRSLAQHFGVRSLILALLIVVYVGWGALFKRVRIVHQTTVTLVLGLICGLIIRRVGGEEVHFNYNVFSYLLLPAIVFAAGFDLRRKNFVAHMGLIISLSLSGTFLVFLVLLFGASLVRSTPLTLHHRLVMAAVLSSTDSIVSRAILPSRAFPSLHAIVFGEGVLNDVVAIVLSTAAAGSDVTPTMLSVWRGTLWILGASSAFGLAFGLGIAVMFRYATTLQEDDAVARPCALFIIFNYINYVLAEVLGLSGTLSLLVCSIFCCRSVLDLLSEEAQTLMWELASLLSLCAEACVFGYCGLAAAALFGGSEEAPALIAFYTAGIVFARLLSIMRNLLVAWFFGCARRRTSVAADRGRTENSLRLARCSRVLRHVRERAGLAFEPLTIREHCLVAYTGCMRGALACALVLRLLPPSGYQTPREATLITTVVGVVLTTTLVLGSALPLVLRVLAPGMAAPDAPQQPADAALESHASSLADSYA